VQKKLTVTKKYYLTTLAMVARSTRGLGVAR